MTISRLVPVQNSAEAFYCIKPELQLLEKQEQMAHGYLTKVILTNIFLLNLNVSKLTSALSR